VLRHYLKRMHIEQSFRDEQSGGFDLTATHLSDTMRLSHLLLVVAVAVLWIYELGENVLRDARRSIDPAYRRQLSVFQLGWGFLQRQLSCATAPPCTLRLKPFKLDPIWRRKQAAQAVETAAL
jgi:hypothetical protein